MKTTITKWTKNRCQPKKNTHPGTKKEQRQQAQAQVPLTRWTCLMIMVLKQRNWSQLDSSNKSQSKGQESWEGSHGMACRQPHNTPLPSNVKELQEPSGSAGVSKLLTVLLLCEVQNFKHQDSMQVKRWHLLTAIFTVKIFKQLIQLKKSLAWQLTVAKMSQNIICNLNWNLV